MRTALRPQGVPAHAWLQVCGVALTGAWLLGSEQVPKPVTWPRVHIEDAFTRIAVEWALTGAAQWLSDERCRGVLTEFRDAQGRPLAERLDTLGVDAPSYLKLILFRDGAQDPHCADELTFAVTTPGGRVVFVCGRRFERAWRASATRAQAIVLHEVLHTLGLGENPPASTDITYRVLTLCDDSETRGAGEPVRLDDREQPPRQPYAYRSRIRGIR
jgi:hypothetical protein